MTPRRLSQAGFTLVELVIVMLLLAILAGLGATRFASTEAFAAQGLADRLASSLRGAQATAQAQRRTVHVQIGATPPTMQVCLDMACTQSLAAPTPDGLWLPAAPALSLDAGASFSFSPSGATSLGSALQLQVLGGGASSAPTVRVEAATGHVRRL
ncbi:MAG: prepilin-type N-terminal cleavage/methylation domain-containing protein [Rubrivivax sp.]|nr:prepilin-type N-terminal cleavage/methylation domain-containing protein [Rubrivivax sp.]